MNNTDPARESNTAKNEAHVGKSGLTKIDRYGWAKPGARGELHWVDPKNIQIDARYQRGVNENKVKTIARDFSWPAFGVVLLAQRADGALFAFDAQHRVLAARRRADVDKVPALVFPMADTKEEAHAFLQANTLRRPLTAVDRHRALVIDGDSAAKIVADLLAQSGRKASVSRGQRTVSCLNSLILMARLNPSTLRRLWPLFMQLTESAPLVQTMVGALFYLECNAVDLSQSMLDPLWSKKLLAIGADGIVLAARKAAQFRGVGGAKIWADGVAAALNKGQHSRKITLFDATSASTAA